jgi:hypothetical protein
VVCTHEVSSVEAIKPDRTGIFTDSISHEFGIYRRIATTSRAIHSLQATADAFENIIITYADEDGQQFTLKLDSNRNLIR